MKEKIFLKIVSLFQLGIESQNDIAVDKEYRELIVNALKPISKNDMEFIFQLFNEPQYRDFIRGSFSLFVLLEQYKSDVFMRSRFGFITPEKFSNILSGFLIRDVEMSGNLKIYDVKAVSGCLCELFQIMLRFDSRPCSLKSIDIFDRIYDKLALDSLDNMISGIKSLYFKDGYKPFSDDFNNKKTEYEQLLKDGNKEARVYLLGEFSMDKFYVRPKLIYNFDSPVFLEKESLYWSRSVDLRKDCFWNEIFLKNNVISIIGGPGYGKTLFLKNLICHFEELKIFDSKDYLVIYGNCKDYEYILNKHPNSFVDSLSYLVNWYYLIDFEYIKEMVRYYIMRGRCIMLFDALDEVNSDRRENVQKSILNAIRFINPSNLVCIVSRERGFITKNFKANYRIPPLNNNDITKYVNKMVELGKFKKEDVEDFLKQARPMMEQGLLNSFLVLSLLVNIYNGESSLPETKLELYQKCYEYIYLKREDKIFKSKDYQEEGVLEEKRKKLRSIMRLNTFYELARMCTPNNNDISKEKIEEELVPIYTNTYGNANEALYAVELFLTFCAERTELFVLSGTVSNDKMVEDQYRFFHRAFCEYFYSQYIYTRENLPDRIFNQLTSLSVDSEVYELLLNTLKNQKQELYETLILLILDKMESDSNEERKTAVRILSICFTSIIEEHFRNRFICFLKNSPEWVVANIDCIMYQEEIAAYICSAREYEGRGWTKKEISFIYKVFHQINVLNVFINQYSKALELIHKNLELNKYEKKIKQAGRNRFLKYFYDIVCEEEEEISTFLIQLTNNKVSLLLRYSKTDNGSGLKNTEYASLLGLSRSDIEKLKKDYKYFFKHTSTDERTALAELYGTD